MNALKRKPGRRWRSPAALSPAPRRRRSRTTSSRSACCPTCRASTPTSPARARSLAARMAVEDSGIEKRGYKVEFVSADHQNKPDVGSAIARQWYDTDKVDVIVDVPNSGVALAVNQITQGQGQGVPRLRRRRRRT